MSFDKNSNSVFADAPFALQVALETSQVVKAKVEACADELASANSRVKQKIADGATMLSAHKALARSQAVETTVQECADDLTSVTKTLVEGIDDLEQTEIALMQSHEALAQSEAALTVALEGEKQATLRALHDPATGLPNRALFDDRLAHAIALAERHGWTLAVMFLDLDRFKSVNDVHGHAAGDSVLKEVARRLSLSCRDEDTVCRNGGDEFLYLLMNPQGSENIERIAGSVVKNIAQPIRIDDLQLFIEPSIGIAIYPDDGMSGEELIRNADAAMYRAKKGMSRYALFCTRQSEKVPARALG